MKTLGQFVVHHRWTVLGLTLLVTLISLLGFPRLRVESDLVKWLNPHDPVVQRFKKIGRQYGGTQMVMVVLESNRLFSPEGLRLVRDLTETYRTFPGVSSVTSLTNILDIRKTDEGLEVTHLLDPHHLPTTPEEIEKLRAYVLSRDLYRGQIVSTDGKKTLILARLQEDIDKASLAREIRDTTLALARASGLPVYAYFGGAPMEMVEVSDLVMADLRRLLPFAVLVVLTVLLLGFRSLRGVVLPLAVVLIATLWTLGLMGWLGVPLSIVSNVIPVILIAVGTAYGIHFIARYREAMTSGRPVSQGLIEALEGVGTPIVLAGLTTLAGFLSFLGAYLVPINHFGLFTALGVAFAMGLTLTFLPAVLSFLPPPSSRFRSLERGAQGLDRWLRPLELRTLQHPRGVLAGALVVLAFAGWGLTRISTSVNLMEYFPKNSNIRRSSEVLRRAFGGDTPVQFLVAGDLRNPFVLQEMFRFEKFLRTVPDVHYPQSLADLIAQMNETMNGRYTIPETPEAVTNLRFLLEGEEILQQLVRTEDDGEGVIQATYAGLTTDQVLKAYQQIERYLHNNFAGELVPIRVTRTLPGPLRRALAERAFTQVQWDLSYHLGKPVSLPTALVDSLVAWQFRPVPLGDSAAHALEQSLFTYFLEEADVPLPERRAERLARAITQAAMPGILDTLQIRRILQRGLPSPALRADPELLSYTLESIASLVDEALRNARVEHWLTRLLTTISDAPLINADLRRDLKGDLWLLVQRTAALPAPLVRSVGLSPDTVVTLQIQPAGMLPVEVKIHRNILRGQARSFLLAFVIVAILVSLQLHSTAAGLLATFPILLVVAFNFGLMGFLGVPLDTATMLIASIAIGIGIDYTIHMISRYRREILQTSDPQNALLIALQTTGRAILLNAFTVGLGFLVLMFASLTPLRRLGWMVALTMATSALAALLFLPAVILTFQRLFKPKSKEVNAHEKGSSGRVLADPDRPAHLCRPFGKRDPGQGGPRHERT